MKTIVRLLFPTILLAGGMLVFCAEAEAQLFRRFGPSSATQIRRSTQPYRPSTQPYRPSPSFSPSFSRPF